MADGDLHLSSRRVGIALQGMLQRCPKAAMAVFPTGMVLGAGKGGGGGGGVWREGGEEERGREGGGLCLEETLRAPVPRPFKNPSARPVPFQALSSVLSGTFASAVRALDHDHGKRRRRLTTCQSCHSSVWYSLSLLLCVDLVCARSTQKNDILFKNKQKMSYCSAHHTFRTHHAASEKKWKFEEGVKPS